MKKSCFISTIEIVIGLAVLTLGVLGCGPPTKNPHSIITPAAYRYTVGQLVRLDCRKGYAAVNGSRHRICQSSGSWTGKPLNCVRSLGCRRPRNPPNGVVLFPYSSKNKLRLQHGSVIIYKCNEGFTLVAKSRSVCMVDRWNHNPFCKATPRPRCAHRPPPEDGTYIKHQQQKTDWYSGEVAKYQCNNGFTLTGSNVSLCLATGRWSTNMPQCQKDKRILCSHRPNPRNGRYTASQQTKRTWYVNDEARFECNTGFVLRGSQISRCLSTGRWNRAIPICFRICQHRPPPSNGRYTSSQSSKTIWSVRDQARFECNEGYVLQGNQVSICLSNGRWNSRIPTCRRTCLHRPAPQGGAYTPAGKLIWAVGDVVSYTCADGYALEGARHSRCRSTGTWTTRVPICRVEQRNPQPCNRPPNPSGGIIESAIVNQKFFSTGDHIMYRCYPGYRLVGEAQVICTEGVWSHLPACIEIPRITCAHRSAPRHGSYQEGSKTTWYRNEEATFLCDSGYTLIGIRTSLCSSTGTWSSDVPICEQFCPHRNAPQNGAYIARQTTKTRWRAGDVATYICNSGYFLIRSNSRCLEGGVWSNPVPKCERKQNQPNRCTLPSLPANGRIETFPPGKTNFLEGEYIQYVCNSNYVIDGEGRVGCLSGSWTHVPVCRGDRAVQQCTLPSFPPNGRIITNPPGKTLFSEGEYITYVCNEYYRVDGDGRVGCFNNRWSYIPVCRPSSSCAHRPNPPQLEQIGEPQKTSWFSGESVSYRCILGYLLVGSNHVTCQSNGVWSAPLPVCIEIPTQENHQPNQVSNPENGRAVTCPHRPAPINGIYIQDVGKTVWRPGDIARYRCNPNFILVGHDYTDCQNNGTWRFSVPKCRRGCRRPQNPRFGSVHFNPPNKQQFVSGDTVVYRCQNGYRLQGESRVYCQNHVWSSTPTCRFEVTCPYRPAPRNGIYIQDEDKTQWFVGDIARYRCDRGYRMRGHSYIDCLPDGTWRFDLPSCHPEDSQIDFSSHPHEPHEPRQPQSQPTPSSPPQGECSYPPLIQHGSIHINPPNRGQFPLGNVVIYRCNLGYEIRGSSAITCQQNGWSSPPVCRRSGCVRPSSPQNGMILPGNKQLFSNSESITYKCDKGFTLEGSARAVCQNRTWSHSPSCRRPCPHRSPPAHGRYSALQRKWVAGDVAHFTCYEGYTLNGRDRSTCQMDGSWQFDVPTCIREKSTASCQGKCGFVNAGGCGCDYKCSSYYDCCLDFNLFCKSNAHS